MNLTAVKEVNEVMERHIEDSLAIIPPINNFYTSHCGSSCDNLNLVDVGTGAGLPGLILAIASPGGLIQLTLLVNINSKVQLVYFLVNLFVGSVLILYNDVLLWIGWKVTLLESMNKRCVFLEHAVSLTGLSNVQVVRGRAEVFILFLPPPNFSRFLHC